MMSGRPDLQGRWKPGRPVTAAHPRNCEFISADGTSPSAWGGARDGAPAFGSGGNACLPAALPLPSASCPGNRAGKSWRPIGAGDAHPYRWHVSVVVRKTTCRAASAHLQHEQDIIRQSGLDPRGDEAAEVAQSIAAVRTALGLGPSGGGGRS